MRRKGIVSDVGHQLVGDISKSVEDFDGLKRRRRLGWAASEDDIESLREGRIVTWSSVVGSVDGVVVVRGSKASPLVDG